MQSEWTRLRVLVVSPEGARPVELPDGRELLVGSDPSAEVHLPGAAPQQLRLRARGDRVEVEELGRGQTRLNDVQVRGRAEARPGDQLTIGDSALVVVHVKRQETALPWLTDRDGLVAQLESEVARAEYRGRPLEFFLIRLDPRQPFITQMGEHLRSVGGFGGWGEMSPEILGLVVAEASQAALESLRSRMVSFLGAMGRPFALGHARYPEDGADAEELMECALARLSGRQVVWGEEPVRLDPVMLRLWAVMSRLAKMVRPVLLVGPAGCGKRQLAQVLHQKWVGEEAPVVVFRGTERPELQGTSAEAQSAQWNAALDSAFARAAQGTLLLERIDALPKSVQHQLAKRLASAGRVVVTTHGSSLLRWERLLRQHLGGRTVEVPALADRASEIIPLAEQFLSWAGRTHGRQLSLGAEARELLKQYEWPGNIRQLKNTMEWACLLANGAEVRGVHLPRLVSRASRESDLRASLMETEREVLLQCLQQTAWNVSEAARRLGLPRRTVVYRMSRLGLRRPARG